ncbi:universal stress protein [Flavobacteriaceae bacterium TK19130]|nr:universal stress protein [Thermobacterium salinum]
MKKILVATDFSDNSYRALLYIVKLLGREPLDCVILHSFSDKLSTLTSRVDIGKSEKLMDELYDEADAEGEKYIKKVKADDQNKHHAFEMISTSMSLTRAINKLVADRGIDLVVMGSTGRTAAQDVFLGSNTIQVLSKLRNAPLLIVPKDISFVIPSHIAFATDFKDSFPAMSLEAILRFAKEHQSLVHVLHVGKTDELDDQQQASKERIRKVLQNVSAEFHWLTKKGSVSETLMTYLDDHDIDMLAMVYHRHNVIVQWFREAVVKKIGKKTTIPYLVIPTD